VAPNRTEDTSPEATEGETNGSQANQPPVSRILAAGAKGAERVAHATGVDRALNQAAEEAIVRALRSPAVIRAIERAVESQDSTTRPDSNELAQLVKRALETDAAGQAWREILESEQAQMLVERIAGAPEIREAIASQGAGLITDIGVRLTVITEGLDDALERITRPRDPDSEIDQAGLATRAMAGAIDLALLFAGYALLSGAITSLITAVFGRSISLSGVIILAILGVLVGGGIFAAFWALAGQTPGMRFLAIRVTQADGSREMSFGHAFYRVLAVIVSLLPLGLGYLAILRDPRRRAWADRVTGTEVIYDTVTRTAPHAGAGPTSAAAARHRHKNA
jgi:uncharacterized RDD family membrane protein YckC